MSRVEWLQKDLEEWVICLKLRHTLGSPPFAFYGQVEEIGGIRFPNFKKNVSLFKKKTEKIQEKQKGKLSTTQNTFFYYVLKLEIVLLCNLLFFHFKINVVRLFSVIRKSLKHNL